MSDSPASRVAIVDYGMGNLFSVKHACEQAGMAAVITRSAQDILTADAVILPGIGAFGDAMDTLQQLDLVGVLRDFAASHKPLVGICLGMQLLMTESHEFGVHRGLGIIEGEVMHLHGSVLDPRALKVPHVGWSRIYAHTGNDGSVRSDAWWQGSLLDGLREGEYMYFVHSFYANPQDSSAVLSVTRYGSVQFCSSVRRGSVSGYQFHPERSGPQGLRMYRNLAAWIATQQ